MASSLISNAARRLEGKVALITGGSNGIGESTARLFRRHGAEVVVADIQDVKGRSLAVDIGASYVHCDVTDESHVERAVDAVVSRHGRLDVMFANAGIVEDSYTPIFATPRSAFERVLATNVTGVFLSVKHAARVMAPARAGSIVCTASAASVVAGATPHGYTCSKHAVLGIMRNAAVELGQVGVRVNCVSPHITSTALACAAFGMGERELEEFTEAAAVLRGRLLKAADTAEAVLYLASDDAQYVSGHNLMVDGGFSRANFAIPPFKYP